MSVNINPPIKERTTQALLLIAGAPEEWRKEVVDQALLELEERKVDRKRIVHAQHLFKRKGQLKALKKAKESFSIGDFIFEPVPSLIEILFYWEYKKEGYLTKARQQKQVRIVLLIVFLIVIVFLIIWNAI